MPTNNLPSKNNPKSKQLVKTHHTSSTNDKCVICNDNHSIWKCKPFKDSSPHDRFELVKRHKLCLNCLRSNHKLSECRSQYDCSKCQKRHHTLLHRGSQSNDKVEENSSGSESISHKKDGMQVVDPNSIKSHLSHTKLVSHSRILLATVRVWVLSPSHRAVRVRALLDQGSTWTFVSRDLARVLGVTINRISQPLSGIGGSDAGSATHVADIRISPYSHGEPFLATTTLILPRITSYVSSSTVSTQSWSHLSNINLADGPSNDDPIHLLIGANLYGAILLNGLRKGKIDEPIAQNTIFGWVISGNTRSTYQESTDPITVHHLTTNAQLNFTLENFWKVEDVPRETISSLADEMCENHFKETHWRQGDGRYVVCIPFKIEPLIAIGHSKYIAEQSLKRLESRLARNETNRKMYVDFMREYESLGHMKRITHHSTSARVPVPVYLPHHPVFRESSQTTKLRVVFNASAKTSNNTSLNDHMHIGPTLQSDSLIIVLNWRSYEFVFAADLAKMYRRILMNQCDVDFQRILWRESSEDQIQEYQLQTVTYGTRSAPFLALRVIKQLVEDEGKNFPIASLILLLDTFVDDLLFGAHSKADALNARDEVIALLARAQFQARKWTSNSLDLLAGIDSADHGLAWIAPSNDTNGLKILGIHWDPRTDAFGFKVAFETPDHITKRITLSCIAKLYDPNGWIAPVIIIGKLFMQRLWRENYSWDEPLPDNLAVEIREYFDSLNQTEKISIPRWTGYSLDIVDAQLHGFSDASERAYGAVAYFRVQLSSGDIRVSLLASKSKVAPVRQLSIPRLELLGAVLLARLLDAIRKVQTLSSIPFQCWTDASIVLSWLGQHASRWKTFVANRISEIHTLLPEHQWHHVPTQTNPADPISRGQSVYDLLENQLWWNGPPWLCESENQWPENLIIMQPAENLEEKLHTHATRIKSDEFEFLEILYNNCSTWRKILRSLSYALKYIQILQRKASRQNIETKSIDANDINSAESIILKHLQKLMFSDEITALKNNKPIPRRSKLAALNPFLVDGIIRVGGRLEHASLPFDAKHPIVLEKHPVSSLIIRDMHERCLHGGVQLTLSTVRQRFWIIHARSAVKSIVHKCVDCAKYLRATTPTQLMANLPSKRVTRPLRAFVNCGVDYAGPLQVRTQSGRGYKSHPCYIAVFVCFAVKAIHLELVSSYSTEAFIAAFKRFISRRGIPSRMYSVCGTTFRGADREMKNAFEQACNSTEFSDFLTNDRITWYFNPPAAPHFGGLWEAGVKSVKTHLKCILRNKTPTFEELTTLLYQIESVLNSRPITPMNDHIDNFDVLTPGHFLAGGDMASIPEPSLVHLKEDRLSRWQLMQQCLELFWKRWTTDYLQSLQRRSKWRFEENDLKPRQLVLLKQPNMPVSKWPCARVDACIPSRDGNVRIVKVRTAKSSYLRPITDLALLPIECEE